MSIPLPDNPFAVLTLIAAPAVFTNASSVLALGTGNRLARVVDRTRELGRELRTAAHEDKEVEQMWHHQLDRLDRRGGVLGRALSFFYTSIGAFAPPTPVSIFGGSPAGARYSLPLPGLFRISFVLGS